MANNKRYDKKRRLLKKGEQQRADGYYVYRWTDRRGQRHSVNAKTLEELREKEEGILKNSIDGIRSDVKNATVNDVYELWCKVKRGLKDNTFQNYKYMYTMFVKPQFGELRLQTLKKSDVKQFYNSLIEDKGLKINTIDNIHSVLHQVLQMAVEDNYIRANVSDGVMKELKRARNVGEERRKALTIQEQTLFLDFLKPENSPYHRWYPIFAVMAGTGMRVGEVTGLRWCDVDFEEGVIEVNHTLVYYSHGNQGCSFNVHTPKTEAGKRTIPMLQSVKEALLEEKELQEMLETKCTVTIDGYTDFIFINRF